MAPALHRSRRVFDVVIIGGGPAGLSAALVLGRCRRHVLLQARTTLIASGVRDHVRDIPGIEGITVHSGSIARVEHEQREAGQSAQCDLAVRPGCEITRQGIVKTGMLGQTRVPGLYVVGAASRDVQFAIVAAAEGAKAAGAVNKALQERAGPGVTP